MRDHPPFKTTFYWSISLCTLKRDHLSFKTLLVQHLLSFFHVNKAFMKDLPCFKTAFSFWSISFQNSMWMNPSPKTIITPLRPLLLNDKGGLNRRIPKYRAALLTISQNMDTCGRRKVRTFLLSCGTFFLASRHHRVTFIGSVFLFCLKTIAAVKICIFSMRIQV